MKKKLKLNVKKYVKYCQLSSLYNLIKIRKPKPKLKNSDIILNDSFPGL